MDPTLIGEILSGLMFVGVIVTLLLGYPVAFSLAGSALIFALVGWLLGVFDPSSRSASAWVGGCTLATTCAADHKAAASAATSTPAAR